MLSEQSSTQEWPRRLWHQSDLPCKGSDLPCKGSALGGHGELTQPRKEWNNQIQVVTSDKWVSTHCAGTERLKKMDLLKSFQWGNSVPKELRNLWLQNTFSHNCTCISLYLCFGVQQGIAPVVRRSKLVKDPLLLDAWIWISSAVLYAEFPNF
jgi:hypothetical protein